METKDLIEVSESLQKKQENIAQSIAEEDNIDKVRDLTQLFNLNSAKKSVVRATKYNELLDYLTDEMELRVKNGAAAMDNDDLLRYLNAVQNVLDKSEKSAAQVDEVKIVPIQNNQININIVPEMDRDSRLRVIQAAQALLNKVNKNNVIEGEFSDGRDKEGRND